MRQSLRDIPSVDKSLRELLRLDPLLKNAPSRLLASLVTSYWDERRAAILNGDADAKVELKRDYPLLLVHVRQGLRPRLHPVLNGAGVVVHTNLGRSVLAEEACQAVCNAASGYCSLEMNPQTGERGSRGQITAGLLRLLTGCEDSLVVNNNAAAVLLVLDTLCRGGETIVSRGELVEIGGSFRIPDIMAKSGSILREVGTTNRTHPRDYLEAIGENTKAIMRVHASNFRISGFHSDVPLPELKKIAAASGLPLLVDLGSGCLLDFSASGLPAEPVVGDVLKTGADVVCFSGDKALGGPQAGIIVGKAKFVEQMRVNPLARALRCGKLPLAALEATLRLYLDEDKARKSVPTPAMISLTPEILAKRAASLARSIKNVFKKADIACKVSLCPASSRVGGGAFPECILPTTLVCLRPDAASANALRSRLLQTVPPLTGRIEKDAFCLDPRTLPQNAFKEVARVLVGALQSPVAAGSHPDTQMP